MHCPVSRAKVTGKVPRFSKVTGKVGKYGDHVEAPETHTGSMDNVCSTWANYADTAEDMTPRPPQPLPAARQRVHHHRWTPHAVLLLPTNGSNVSDFECFN